MTNKIKLRCKPNKTGIKCTIGKGKRKNPIKNILKKKVDVLDFRTMKSTKKIMAKNLNLRMRPKRNAL